MTEQLMNSLNDPTSTLASGISNTDTSLSVSSGQGSRFPANGNFRIKIDSELILVGARSTDSLTSLTRGIEGTTAASHSSGANIELVLTQAGLLKYIQEQGPGAELDYAQITANVTGITATTEGTASTVIDGNAISLDGSTRVKVEAFAPAHQNNGSDRFMILLLLRNTTVIGRVVVSNGLSNSDYGPLYIAAFETPSNGTYTYHFKAYVNAGTGIVDAGAGGTGNFVPAYLRVTRA